MRSKVGTTTYESRTFVMSIIRQRTSKNLFAYNVASAYTHLQKSFQLISNESAIDEEVFNRADHNIKSLRFFSLASESSFGIELFTTHSINENDPIFILFAVDEYTNLFIIEQAGLHGVLSRKSIENLINAALFGFQITSEANESFYAEVNNCLISKQSQSMINKHRQLLVEIKHRVTQGFIQLSLFDNKPYCEENLTLTDEKYSNDVFNSFEVNKSILELKKDAITTIYNKINKIVPTEIVSFSMLSINQALVCEMISAAICHQINWDFLRSVILNKTIKEPRWIEPINLAVIKVDTINSLLSNYEKADRIRAEERTRLLRILGTSFASLPNGFIDIFYTESGLPQSAENIRNALITCPVFSNDPVEKKLQLLLQKLSSYEGFEVVGNYCKPTIDYHLIRSFLRRGFLIPKTKRAKEIITTDIIREEKTVGAIRKHCVNIIELLSKLTNLNISTVNNIEWWIGRTVCNDGDPDCLLENTDANWLSSNFCTCPFKDFCNPDSTILSAPKYSGNSY